MTISNLIEEARIDAVDNIAVAIAAGADKELRRHGKDPKALTLLATGFVRAIQDINRGVNPRFGVLVAAMLAEENEA